MLLDLYRMATVVTGAGTIAFSVCDPEAIGAEVFTGAATEAFTVSALTASGGEVFGGTATEAFTVSALAGAGLETFAGAATEQFSVPDLSSAGSEVFTGSATEDLTVSALSGSGLETFTGNATEAITVSALASSALEIFTGSDTEGLTVSDIAASGTVSSVATTGTATVDLSAPALSGAGFVPTTGIATVDLSVADLSASSPVIAAQDAPVVPTDGMSGGGWYQWVQDVKEWKQPPVGPRPLITGTVEMALSAPAIEAEGLWLPKLFPVLKKRAKPKPRPLPITGTCAIEAATPIATMAHWFQPVIDIGPLTCGFPAGIAAGHGAITHLGSAVAAANAPCLAGAGRVYPLALAYQEDEALWWHEEEIGELLALV